MKTTTQDKWDCPKCHHRLMLRPSGFICCFCDFEISERLIVTAPDMKRTIELLIFWHEHPTAPDDIWSMARDILAKIENQKE